MASDATGTRDRLTGSDWRTLLLWLLLGVAGLLFASKYYFAAFPEAAVNFQVSRAEALERARKFVAELGSDVSGYQSSIVFAVDDNAKTYLERELKLAQANRLMSSEVRVWYWEVRYFRPLQEEEYRVRVSPMGGIVGYRHTVEEARAGASLERAAAEAEASRFLATRYGAAPGDWAFLPEEANSITRPKRLDWSFTWEKRNFRAKEAPYRLRVTLLGDKIGGAEEFLQVPEAWERDYKRLRSTNIFYNQVAILPYVVLLGAALWFAVGLTRRGQAHWRMALKLGGFVAAVLFLMQLNQWPIARAGYDTRDSYSTFVASQLALALLFALGSALAVTLVLPAGNAFYRVTQPWRVRLSAAFTWRGLRSKEFFNSAFIGLCMAGMHIGFVVAFYLLGGRLGVWAPQELNYENSVSTAFPWISGAAIGIYAATSEEFLFRLFAIPFVERVTKSRWLAVILPAFFWSFLHSAYPQEPGYIRGIEVGMIGIVAGIVLLRWGIVATLIWHYTVDALLTGLLLIRSHSLYFKISGAAVGAAAVAPLLFAGVSYLLRGRFESDDALLNRAEPAPILQAPPAAPAEATRAAPVRPYSALSTGTLGFLAICIVLGGLLSWKLRPEFVGDYLRLSVDARGARRIADDVMRSRNLHPESYRAATTLVPLMDPITNEYLREALGIADTNRIYAQQVPGALWRVRYFRDGQPEEYAVIVRPDGALHAVRHTLAEAAPGGSLTKEEALGRAEAFLKQQKHIDLNRWHLVESNSNKRPLRIDHTLTWEETAPLAKMSGPARYPAGEAHARMEVQVLGDEVTNYRTFVKIPEEWRRKHEERTLPHALYSIVRWLFFAALGLTPILLFIKGLRSEAAVAVPWRQLARWGLWGLAGFLGSFLFGSAIPTLLANYPTEIPLKFFYGGIGVGALLISAAVFGGLALLFGLAWYYGARAFGDDRLPGWRGMPGSYYRDAFWIALAGMAVLGGVEALINSLGQFWPTVHRSLEAVIGSDYDALSPFAGMLGGAVWRGLFSTAVVAVAAMFIAAEVRRVWLRIALFILLCTALVGSWGSPADFLKQFAARTILLAVVVWGVRRIIRFNLLGCFLIVAGAGILEGAVEFLGQPNLHYRVNGHAVLAALAVLLAWPLVAWRLGSRPQVGTSS